VIHTCFAKETFTISTSFAKSAFFFDREPSSLGNDSTCENSKYQTDD
jgi:hypothetical protein